MKRRRGYSLVEMLVTLVLFAAFSVLAYRLVYANFQFLQGTIEADSNTARFDRAVVQLRADVQSSSKLEMKDAGHLRIQFVGDRVVQWKANSGVLSRVEKGQTRTWTVGHPIVLKLDGAVALLSISPTDEIAMAAPVTTGGAK
jgi:prepilin-type N-terminal cleavage/methylation domain-containing protein